MRKSSAGLVERFQSLHRSIEAKRLELCPWEQFGIECEEAFAYQQTWICPSQGWNRLQRAVDAVARQSQGSAFVPNKAYWPVTLMVLARTEISKYWGKAPKAPPFGSNEPEIWIHTKSRTPSPAQDMQNDVKWVNSNLIKSALSLVESSGWEEVSTEDGIKIWRKYLSPDTMIAGKRLDSAAKFACVKAHTIIDAPIDEVYSLFVDNKRVHEYNEYCKEVQDLEWLDDTTKVTYSLTGRPWSRDFVTRVHYCTLPDSTRVIVNRAEEHHLAPIRPNYTRMTMPLGANILRPAPGDSKKTELTLITHLNPGGFAQTHFGAMVTNRLSTDSPRQFLSRLNAVAHRSTVPKRCSDNTQQSAKPWRFGWASIKGLFSSKSRGDARLAEASA
jgi:hypothetical protein